MDIERGARDAHAKNSGVRCCNRAVSTVRFVEKHMEKVLEPLGQRIPRGARADTRQAYSETPPKTLSKRSRIFNARVGGGAEVAMRIGPRKRSVGA